MQNKQGRGMNKQNKSKFSYPDMNSMFVLVYRAEEVGGALSGLQRSPFKTWLWAIKASVWLGQKRENV